MYSGGVPGMRYSQQPPTVGYQGPQGGAGGQFQGTQGGTGGPYGKIHLLYRDINFRSVVGDCCNLITHAFNFFYA